jgi:hypothetical protein
MFIGWVIWWVLSKNGKYLTIKSIGFAFVYGWTFLPLTWVIYRIDPVAYLIADIPFQINMAVSNIITIELLFLKLNKLIKKGA